MKNWISSHYGALLAGFGLLVIIAGAVASFLGYNDTAVPSICWLVGFMLLLAGGSWQFRWGKKK